jgi:hypothetical protein
MMLRRTPHFDFAPPHRDLQSRWGLEPRLASRASCRHRTRLSCIYDEANLGVTLGAGSGAGAGPVSTYGCGACAGASSDAGFEARGNERLAWIAAPAAVAVLVTDSAQFSSGAGVRSMGGVGCGVGCGGSVSTGEGSSPGAPASVAPSSAAAAFFAAGSSPGSQRARSGASASGTNSSAPSRQTGVSAGSAPCAIHTANVAVGNGPCT